MGSDERAEELYGELDSLDARLPEKKPINIQKALAYRRQLYPASYRPCMSERVRKNTVRLLDEYSKAELPLGDKKRITVDPLPPTFNMLQNQARELLMGETTVTGTFMVGFNSSKVGGSLASNLGVTKEYLKAVKMIADGRVNTGTERQRFIDERGLTGYLNDAAVNRLRKWQDGDTKEDPVITYK